MKKLACLFLANIIFLGVFMQNVQADDINFCENCGAKLETHAIQAGHWETDHRVYYNKHLDGKQLSSVCHVGYTAYEVGKICPNGHGAKETFTHIDEFHSINHTKNDQIIE